MEEPNRPIIVYLKLFTRAFPERICIQLSPGARVGELMEKVERKNFEGLSRKRAPLSLKDMAEDDLLVILNGRLINNLQGYDTPLEDGDVLAVFPVMAGG